MTPATHKPEAPASGAPAWLRDLGTLTVVAIFLLLGLGSVVTTFKVGMADPIWPTVPWQLALIDWTEPDPGFLVEHAHRAAAFAVGGIMALLAVLVWLREPRSVVRWIGFAAIIGLLVTFGMLHRDLMRVPPTEPLPWPMSANATLTFWAIAVVAAASGLLLPGGGVRLGVIVALGAVMVQGLLGGLRVRLNVYFGTDLAALHGVLAQLIFAGVAGLTVLLSVRARPPGASVAGGIRALAWGCVGVLVLQLIWGAALRHTGWTTMQRLHFLTAFVALAGIVWLIVQLGARREAWHTFGTAAVVLAVLVSVQLMLGVETWFSKFSRGVAPELQLPVTTALQATIRTLHVLIGAALLATATALAVRASLATPPVTVTVPGIETRRPVESWA